MMSKAIQLFMNRCFPLVETGKPDSVKAKIALIDAAWLTVLFTVMGG